jgi:RNA polymerase sigma-70 factor (ECF subfamily)
VEGQASSSADSGLRPEAAAEAGELRARILAALAALPFEYREAVVLRDVAGLSNHEVAAALGVSLAAAKSRIHRGRLQLRDRLKGLGEP